MQKLIWTILASFVMAIVFGPVVIPWLKKMKFGQTIYDLGPESHKKKQGIPTMGGIIFAVPAVIASFIFAYNDTRWDFLLICLVCALSFGLIGFVDDFIKVKFKRSLGLTPKQKMIPQIIFSIGLSLWAYYHPAIGPVLKVPFTDVVWNLGWWYIPIMTFILVGTVNSANLLDGLDGLLGGCSLFDFATMALICVCLAGAARQFHQPSERGHFLRRHGGRPDGLFAVQRASRPGVHGGRGFLLHRRCADGHGDGHAAMRCFCPLSLWR